MISIELERNLLHKFISSIDNDDQKRISYVIASNGNPDDFAVKLCVEYFQWMEEKRKTSTDEVFVMILNYVHLVSFYKEFRLALNAGDTIMIEW